MISKEAGVILRFRRGRKCLCFRRIREHGKQARKRQQWPTFLQAMVNLHLSPVSPKPPAVRRPYAFMVVTVGGMNVVVRASASGSEEVAEGRRLRRIPWRCKAKKWKPVAPTWTMKLQRKRRAQPEPRSRRASVRSTSTTFGTAHIGHGARPVCEARPRTNVM